MPDLLVEAKEHFPDVPPEFQVNIYQLFLLLIGADIQTGELVVPYRDHVPRYNLFCRLRWAIGGLEYEDVQIEPKENSEVEPRRIEDIVREILDLQILSKEQLDMLVRGLYCDIDSENLT